MLTLLICIPDVRADHFRRNVQLIPFSLATRLCSVPLALLGSPTSPQSNTQTAHLLLTKRSDVMKTQHCSPWDGIKPNKASPGSTHTRRWLRIPHLTTRVQAGVTVLGFGWLCEEEGKSPRVVGTSLGFAGIRLHLHLVEGEGGFGWHDGPEHVAVVGQGVHAGHGDLAHRQEVLRVLWPQTGRANLQSKETGKGVTQHLGEFTVISFTSVFFLF